MPSAGNGQVSSLVRLASHDMCAYETRRWRSAWTQAAYGECGFALAVGNPPQAHFATSAADPAMAELLAAELVRVAASLELSTVTSTPANGADVVAAAAGRVDVVDAGAGGGELLAGLLRALPARVQATAIDLRTAPDHFRATPDHRWLAGDVATVCPPTRGLIIAHEFLDDVPCDVAVLGADGWRYLLVTPDGTESDGAAVEDADAEWLQRWGPDAAAGTRMEIGRPRDEAARMLAARLTAGALVIVDYTRTAADRTARFSDGTPTGFRDGHQCLARPDGSMNLTAHVAIDSVAASLEPFGEVHVRTVADVAQHHQAGKPLAFADRMRWANVGDRGSWGGFSWLTLDRRTATR